MYMPQILGDEDGLWWDMWHNAINYARAREITNAAVASGISESRTRIIWVSVGAS